ncbi:competence protein ComK [Aquibacillus albus]|uniref:Competence protein ComK n=1 Tax=Aquibacillus albus TaxID=1168171 RepID=A0ABS2N3H1_9BACI|nr:competence protein ComK [Aquibacillus albus]MBM7572683.1 competence protein ComK [Aquibacillus albus]
MPNILPTYDVNEKTIALLPSRQVEYDTIVMEADQRLFVRQTPLEIIKMACLKAGSSYEGCRASLMYLTNSRKKVPIPILLEKNIYAFPTHSPTNFNCQWLFYHHIASIKPHPSSKKTHHRATITFKNGQNLAMNESYYRLIKQMYRTAECITMLSSSSHSIFV